MSEVLNEELKDIASNKNKKNNKLSKLLQHIQNYLIGQNNLVESMLLGLLCDGHLLIEGMPGLAKTTAAKALATGINADFHRIQFTPDLLPSDIVGTDIFEHENNTFSFKSGPIFQNIILADEINRSPAKVQSALLEAMEERQVTVGHKTYKLPELFMVLATQNPIEQEGTYTLPEAQLDRFLMHVEVKYPSHKEELEILSLLEKGSKFSLDKDTKTSIDDILVYKKLSQETYLSPKIKDYIVSIVQATRDPEVYSKDLAKFIQVGASPRAAIALLKTTKALAWLRGEDCVLPEHVQYLAHNILRHRIVRTFTAEAEGITTNWIINKILQQVAIP